jgi:hypothetical protein
VTKLSWRTALALPTAVALSLGGAVLMAAPASAAPDFSVTTPAEGATGVAQTLPNVVPFSGEGLPDGDNVKVTYLDAASAQHVASNTQATNSAGAWTQGENFGELSPGQTTVVATISLLDQVGVPIDIEPITRTFTLAVAPNAVSPFAVTQPASNSTTPVPSTTPTFSGTGAPLSTITITYGAKAGATGTAATTQVLADGSWTTSTDFSRLEAGVTEGSAIVTETDADGNVVPGTTGLRINFVFPSAPGGAVESGITLSPDKTTVDIASTDGVALAATGFSPDEQVTVAVTDATGKAVTLGGDRPAETFASDTDGSYVDDLIIPTSAVGGVYKVTVTGVRSTRVVTSAFYALASPTLTSPANGAKLTGDTVTFSGTGTPGSNIGVIAAPTAEFQAALKAEQDSAKQSMKSSRIATPKAAAPKASSPTDPADPQAPITVGADGTWSVTLAAKPGDYTAVAIAALLDADGNIVVGNTGDPVLAGPSAPVEFVLAAAVVPIVPAGVTPPTALAYTGSNAGPYVITGGLLLLVGLGLMVAARRRRTANESSIDLQ